MSINQQSAIAYFFENFNLDGDVTELNIKISEPDKDGNTIQITETQTGIRHSFKSNLGQGE